MIGDAVRELVRSARKVSSFQTQTACDEHESFISDLADIHFIYGLTTEMNVLLFGFMKKDIERGCNRIMKSWLGCMRTWRNLDSSEPRLKALIGRKLHEHPYSKRMCCMLWPEIHVPEFERLPLQPEDLEQLSIVYCRPKPYNHFMFKECNYYSQMISHDVPCLNSC